VDANQPLYYLVVEEIDPDLRLKDDEEELLKFIGFL
jgi:hypothetical protein